MSTAYIPVTDSGYDAWALNFSAVIAANPASYGLTSSDAAAITAAYNSWHAAYLLASTTGTRTSPTIAAKDVAKAATKVTFQSYAQIIQNNVGVTDMAKSAAGMTVRSTARTPIPAPGTVPILGFVGASPLVATLNYVDTSTPSSKAKPFGALQLELWIDIEAIGTAGTLAAAKFYGLITKSPFVANFASGDVGKIAYYWGRWTTRRGLVGPWSTVLSHAII